MVLRLGDDAVLLKRLSEVAVLISLFAVGLRLRVSLSDRLWRAPLILATLAMLVTIAAMWAFGVALGLASGMALLLAAVLAPTDPVLASDVQVEHPNDRDGLRFSLTTDGCLNDGAEFPFVMLALGSHAPVGALGYANLSRVGNTPCRMARARFPVRIPEWMPWKCKVLSLAR